MNARMSYEWLGHYVDLKGVSPEDFASHVSLSGPAVERITPAGDDLKNVLVGRVTKIQSHPNADKLRIAIVDAGGEPLEIVCGGTNLHEDQLIAVAKVGAKIRWHGEGDLVKLEPAEIRGVKSNGMICAANEIGLFDAFPHEEREILDLGAAIPDLNVAPGTPLADALGLANDVTLDIEVTSNRVDAMGMIGMAREAGAILNRKFLWNPIEFKPPKSGDRINVTVHDPDLCPRYMAVKLTGVKNGQSPWWMKKRLMAAGMNSISLLVDITNYVMLESAQPLHVFDAQQIPDGEINVRRARAGETMKALDGKEYALEDTTLVIADATHPVAIAGIKGGEGSGVGDDTTDMIFEAATFDAVSVRRSARRLNVYSDSQLRYEKGLSTEAPAYALARAVELALELGGGEVAGPVTDVRSEKYKARNYAIDSDVLNERIGLTIPQKEQVRILEDLGFDVNLRGKTITAEVPWWRDHDIESSQDLVEEIARVYGYANIPGNLPVGEPSSRRVLSELTLEDRVRTFAKGAGLTETYTYSFISEELYKKAEYDPSACLELQNPLTEEFRYMRTSLLPSLLQVIAENQERSHDMRLFEVQNVYYRTDAAKRDLPDEFLQLGAAFRLSENGFKHAKGCMEALFTELGIADIHWKRISEEIFWHPGRTVQAYHDRHLLATIGEVSPEVTKQFKIDGRVVMVDCPLESLIPLAKLTKPYRPPSHFPESKRDLAILVDQTTDFDDFARTIERTDPLITNIEWFDTFRGGDVPEGKKSVAVHLTISHPDKTLTSADVDAVLERVSLALRESYHAEIR